MLGEKRKAVLQGFPYFYGPIVISAVVLPAWPFYADTGTSGSMWTYAGGGVAPVFIALTALLVLGLSASVFIPKSMIGVAIGLVGAVMLAVCVPLAWRFEESPISPAGNAAIVVYCSTVVLACVHGLVLTLFRSPSRRK